MDEANTGVIVSKGGTFPILASIGIRRYFNP